jgi:hypothetical protein
MLRLRVRKPLQAEIKQIPFGRHPVSGEVLITIALRWQGGLIADSLTAIVALMSRLPLAWRAGAPEEKKTSSRPAGIYDDVRIDSATSSIAGGDRRHVLMMWRRRLYVATIKPRMTSSTFLILDDNSGAFETGRQR